MKKVNTTVQKRIKKSIRSLMVFGFMGISSFLLTGCLSSWALSPRDKSIKDWEAQHQHKNEKSIDSIQGNNTKSAQKGYDLNLKK